MTSFRNHTLWKIDLWTLNQETKIKKTKSLNQNQGNKIKKPKSHILQLQALER